MRLPTDIGQRGLQIIVDMNAESIDIARPSGSSAKEAMGEELPDDTETDTQADIWLFSQQQNPTDVEFGARVEGTLVGLTQPDADVVLRDRLDFHGEEYEVVDITTLDDRGATIQMIGCEKRINT